MPEQSKAKKRLRDSSGVAIATVVLTVISMRVFEHFQAPLSSNAEIAVVAGFWFVLIGGGVLIWEHLRSRQ